MISSRKTLSRGYNAEGPSRGNGGGGAVMVMAETVVVVVVVVVVMMVVVVVGGSVGGVLVLVGGIFSLFGSVLMSVCRGEEDWEGREVGCCRAAWLLGAAAAAAKSRLVPTTQQRASWPSPNADGRYGLRRD